MQSPFIITKPSAKLRIKTDKSHISAMSMASKEVSFNSLKPSTPKANDELLSFQNNRIKISKKPRPFEVHSHLFDKETTNSSKNKFTMGNLMKINQVIQSNLIQSGIAAHHPININIQNININNIHYHSGRNNNAIKLKKGLCTSKDQPAYFPIITAPNADSIAKGNETTENHAKLKIRKIRLVDLEKLKTKAVVAHDKEVVINDNKDTILSTKKIEVVRDNDESFYDEVADILNNVEEKSMEKQLCLETNQVMNNIEPIMTEVNMNNPNINFEHIHRINGQRPQTSYGGISARKLSLQNSLRQKSSKMTADRMQINNPDAYKL